MKAFLTKSKWKAADLERQSVEFCILGEHGETKIGVARFLAADCPDGLLSLCIVIDRTLTTGSKWGQEQIPVPQHGANAAEIHPDQAVARFRLWSIS